MNEQNLNREDYEDRLADQALAEVLGGKRPPDLSQPVVELVRQRSTSQRHWAKYALAASLFIAVGLGIFGSVKYLGETDQLADRKVALARKYQETRSLAIESLPVSNIELRDDSRSMTREEIHDPYGVHLHSVNQPAQVVDAELEAVKEVRMYSAYAGDNFTRGATASRELDLGTARPTLEPAPDLSDRFSLLPEGVEAASRGDAGRGPGQAGDRYSRIVENPFLAVATNPLSTFSIDVDTASYAKVRRYLLEQNTLPPADAVRLEELINYFSYDYPAPEGEAPFSAHMEVAACPWQPEHRLVKVGLKGKEISQEQRPASNLVFLLDVSGSMEPDDRLPRVRRAMRMLVEQLGENDRVAIVVYAGASGLVLPSTPCDRKESIVAALENLHAGGSTNGGDGIRLAYDTAAAAFIKGGVNRVILCTDGDFNVGTTSTAELERLAEEKAKTGVFLTVLGFGLGNHNDDLLEKLADKGNGNYGYVDSEQEARKLLVEQMGGTLVAIAKDVKLQIEFNPRQVGAYRLIGYENRLLRAEDFNDDTKDAGEIGAGHTVTALYEIVPPGKPAPAASVEGLKYQQPGQPSDAAASGELLTLKLRYKQPDAQESQEPLVFTLRDEGQAFGRASADFKFAAAVASFGMLLRDSQHRGETSYDAVLEIAQSALGPDRDGYRAAFLDLVRKAKALTAPASQRP